MAPDDGDAHIYRYIDKTVEMQGALTRALIAPLVDGQAQLQLRQTELRLEVWGDGNGKPALRTLLRTHVHAGMLKLTRKDLAAIVTIAGGIAAIASTLWSVFRG